MSNMLMLSKLLGDFIPFDSKLEILVDSIQEYGKTGSEESKQTIVSTCMLIVTAEATKGKSVEEVMEQVNKREQDVEIAKAFLNKEEDKKE